MRLTEGGTAADARHLRMALLALRRTAELLLALPAVAIADSARFDILAQPLPGALKIFAEQAHMQLLYDYRVVEHAQGNAVVGVFEKRSALEQLLRNTNLEAVYSSDAAATIRPASGAATPAEGATKVAPAVASESEKALPQSPRQEAREHPVSTTDDHQESNVMPRKSPFARFGAFVASITSTVFATLAHGQEVNGEVAALEEIIVTAERREADLQRTAASITVVTGEQLAEQGRYTLQSILQDMPGVSGGAFSGFGGTGADNIASGITIRGIGSNVGGGGESVTTSSAAAVYVDGVYEGTGGSYDIERVEVLRGPQGTLYGRSATSGLVAIHTRNPELDDFGGDVTAEFGNYNLSHYTAAMNLPIVSDQLAVRVSGNRYERDGYRGSYNASTGEAEAGPGGSIKTTEGRVKLLYKPTEDLSILLGAAMQNNDTQSGGVVVGNSTDRDVVVWENAPVKSSENDYRQYWAQIDWNIGFGILTYQPAYRSWTQYGHAITKEAYLIDTFIDTPEDTFWTHELRLASNPDSKTSWQTGVLSYDNQVKNYNEWRFVSDPIPGALFSSRDTDKSTEALGAFAEATYPIADAWRVTAGLRYDHTKVIIGQHYVSGFPVAGEDTLTKDEGTRTWDNWTYKLRAEHDLAPENMVYASISTGFSPGDVSLAGCLPTICVIELEAETLTAYEVGSKNRFLDNSLQLNGAIFYNDYGAYQTGSLNVSGDPQNPSFAALAVPVRAYGAELELLYQITSADRLGFNVAYTDARYVDKESVPKFAENYAGDELGVSPLTANLSYDHVFNLPGGWTWNLHGDVRYQSAYHDDLTVVQQQLGGESLVRIDAETIGNLSTTVASDGGKFSVTGWVRNVGDNQYVRAATLQTATQPLELTQMLYDPRTYGVSASLKF